MDVDGTDAAIQDPGAVPGGSTTSVRQCALLLGPKQDRLVVKSILASRLSATVIGENSTIANDNRAPVAVAA